MNELEKYKFPILIILILSLLKFLIVPTLTWQDEVISENKLLQRKVSKVANLIEDEQQLTERLEKIESDFKDISKYFYSYENEQSFRLEQQKLIEKQLLKFELKSSSIGWQNTVSIPDTPLIRFQLQYSFTGKSENAISYLVQQQGVQHWQEIETLSVNVRRQKAGRLGQMTITVRLSFYMLNEETSNG
ncbi:hypothetical protein [Pseudoalteromonas gelatinilytica]